MMLKQWFGLRHCREGGLAHSPVSCWADCSFQSNTGDDREKSAVPIRVLREKERRVQQVDSEGERESWGEKRGYK